MISLNKPWIIESDIDWAVKALRKGDLNGEGHYSQLLSAKLCDLLKTRFVLPVSSGTHALELAVMAFGLKPGDEVIMPSFTFSACATAVMRVGAVPVFADIEGKFLGLDPNSAANVITRYTKAIMVVHYGGCAAEIERLKHLAFNSGLFLIEDAAHCLGASFKDKPLGTFGDCGCFSLHSTKNVTVGEGGIFVCQDEKVYRTAQIIRDKGTNRQAFLRGDVDKYTWVSQGSSFLLADVLSALALGQLDRLEKITQLRQRIAQKYLTGLSGFSDCIVLPTVDPIRQTNWHTFFVKLKDPNRRDFVISELRKQGVGAAFHYVPLHLSPMGQGLGYKKGDFPITEATAESLIRLPIYPQMKKQEVETVVRACQMVFGLL